MEHLPVLCSYDMHFSVLVLLKTQPEDLSKALESLLAPYGEDLEVDAYEKQCWCVDAVHRDPEHPGSRPGTPNSECEDCHGSGQETTTSNPEGRWDWWTVGGRWAGALDPSYDPSADPRNFARCKFCDGTGTRKDMTVENGCNVCQGTGVARNWHNAPFDGDVQPVSALPAALPFYALLTPDGRWHQQDGVDGFSAGAGELDAEAWDAYLRAQAKQWPHTTAVVVDCHT